jgi:hypothetical protein
VGWRERAGRKYFKNLLLPCLCICRGEELHSAVQNGTGQFVFFFLRKKNEFESHPKMGYVKVDNDNMIEISCMTNDVIRTLSI